VLGTVEMVKHSIDTALEEKRFSNEIILYLCRNIIGNILIFFPIGCLLPLLWKRFRKFTYTVLFGFLVSLVVECSQLFLVRGTDVDDIILNIAGVMFGYLVFLIINKLFPILAEKFTLQGDIHPAWNIMPFVCTIIPFLVIVIFGFYDRRHLF
jgi:glycopeptide antibiotics resistance protein